MEYWTDLYRELAARIGDNLPEVAWIDLWHEQVNYLTEELPFPTPAVFLAFSTVAMDDRGALVQDCNTQVDVYLFYETFSDTYAGSTNQDGALEFLNQLTRIHALLHGSAGQNYSEMRRVDLRREDSGGAGNLYRASFQCLVTDYSAQHLFTGVHRPDTELQTTPGAIPANPADNDPMYDL